MEIIVIMLAFLGLITTSIAAPAIINSRGIGDPLDPDEAHCFVKLTYPENWIAAEYHVMIGQPYIDGLGCIPILLTLIAHGTDPDGWACEPDEFFGPPGTYLTFTTDATLSVNQAVNDALQEAYPMVPFAALKICVREMHA